jgi:2-polyprenyl-3-methyl-5-hydroxy-6-metoxy-1,4-benzoquinol methylase
MINALKSLANKFERNLDSVEIEKFLNLISKDGNVLDAGCGSGRDCAYMISRGYKVLGIDLSSELLNEAKRLHPEVKTKKMNLTDLKFSPELFDGIWTNAVILHLERETLPGVLNDFHKILKSGGILYIKTKEGSGEELQPVSFNNKLNRLFTLYSQKELEILTNKAGFSLIDSYVYNGLNRGYFRDQSWVVVIVKKNNN